MTSIAVIATGITHEINQPLNEIRIASEGISLWNKMNNHILPDIVVNLSNKISSATNRTNDSIKDMRSLLIQSDKDDIVEINLFFL